jgi:hypothetical protein
VALDLPHGLSAWLGEFLPPTPFSVMAFDAGPALAFRLQASAIFEGLVWMLVFYFLVILCRRVWLAVAVLFALATAYYASTSGQLLRLDTLLSLAGTLGAVGLGVFTLWRFGLLATVACLHFTYLANSTPLTYDFTTWYAGLTATNFLIGIGLAAYCCFISLGGRPLLGEKFFQEG